MDTCVNDAVIASAITTAEDGQILANQDGDYVWVDPPYYAHGLHLLEYHQTNYWLRNNVGQHVQSVELTTEQQGSIFCCVRPYLQTAQYVCIPPIPEDITGILYLQTTDKINYSWESLPAKTKLETPLITLVPDNEAMTVQLTLTYPNETDAVGKIEYDIYVNDVFTRRQETYPNAENPANITLSDVYVGSGGLQPLRVVAVAKPLHPQDYDPSDEAEEETIIHVLPSFRISSITPFNRTDLRQRNRSLRIEFTGMPDPEHMPTQLLFDWRITTEDKPLNYPQTVQLDVPQPQVSSDPTYLTGTNNLGGLVRLRLEDSKEIDFSQPLIVTLGGGLANIEYSISENIRASFYQQYAGRHIESYGLGYRSDAKGTKTRTWDWGTATTLPEYWAVYGLIAYEEDTWVDDINGTMDSRVFISTNDHRYITELSNNYYQEKISSLTNQFVPHDTEIVAYFAKDMAGVGQLVTTLKSGKTNGHFEQYRMYFFNRVTGVQYSTTLEVGLYTAGVTKKNALPMTLERMSEHGSNTRYDVRVFGLLPDEDVVYPQISYSATWQNNNQFTDTRADNTQSQAHVLTGLAVESVGNARFSITGWSENLISSDWKYNVVRIDHQMMIIEDDSVTLKSPVNNTYGTQMASSVVSGKDYIVTYDLTSQTNAGWQHVRVNYLYEAVTGTDVQPA